MIKMFYKASAILAFFMLCTSVKRRPNFERVLILNLLNFIFAQAKPGIDCGLPWAMWLGCTGFSICWKKILPHEKML